MPRKLTVEFIGDTSSLDRSFQKVSKGGKGVTGTFGRMAGSAKFLAGSAALGAVAVGATKAASAFYESQKIGKQTEAVLKSTGGAAKVTAKQIEDLATALSKKTGIDDEAIQSSENLLLTFTKIRNETGKGNQIFTRATKVVQDMSVALGQDGKSSAIQLGKALNDPIKGITSLQRVGVSFTAAQKEQIKGLVEHGKTLQAQKLILRELNTEFGGSAKAQATNMDRLKVTLGNLQESVGSVFVPLLEKASGALNKLVDGMMSGTGAGGRLIQIFKQTGQVLAGVFADAVEFVSGLLKQHRGDLKNVAAAVRNIGTAIKFAWLEVALPIVKRVLPAIKQIVTGTFNVIGGTIKVISSLLTLRFGDAWDGVKQIFKGGAQEALGVLRAITAPIREVASRIGSALKKPFVDAFHGIMKAVQPVLDVLNKIVGVVKDIINFIGKIKIPHISIPFIGGDPKTGGEKMAAMTTGTLGIANRVASKFGLHVTSGYRDPMHNAAVGGAANSLHTHGSSLNPGAIDLVGSPASMYAAAAWAREHLPSLKEILVHDAGSGLNLHLGFFKRGGKVPGSGAGDRVPAMLEPGEFVMQKKIVDMFGPTFFAALNGMKEGGIVTAAKAAKAAGFSGKALVNMVAIAARESSYNPRAANLRYPDHSIGLWQINQLAHKGRFGTDAQLKNPYTNAKAAYALFKSSGYSPWGGRGVSPFHNVTPAMFAAARRAVASLKGKTTKPGKAGKPGVHGQTWTGGGLTPPGPSLIEAGDTGGGGGGGDTGPDPNIERLADLTAEMVVNQRRLIYLSETQGPQVVGAVVAAVNGSIGGKVGLGFSGIRSSAGNVAGL